MVKSWIEIQNEPVEAIRKLPLRLIASKRIRDDSGLTLMSITGKQQGGKSAYSMLVAYEIYGHDVDAVLNHMVFSVEELTEKLFAALQGGYRYRCIIFDDASVTGSAASWMTNPKLVMALGGLGDTLGTICKSLILTSPSGDMIKAFRNYQQYHIMINAGRHKYERKACGYWTHYSPYGQKIVSSEFEDTYDIRIPFYERYAEKRKAISFAAIGNMMDILHEKPHSKKIYSKNNKKYANIDLEE